MRKGLQASRPAEEAELCSVPTRATVSEEKSQGWGLSGFVDLVYTHNPFLNKPLNLQLPPQLPRPPHATRNGKQPSMSRRLTSRWTRSKHSSWPLLLIILLYGLTNLLGVHAGPKPRPPRPTSRAEIHFIAPTASTRRTDRGTSTTELNFDPRSSSSKRKADRVTTLRDKKRQKKAQNNAPLEVVNIMEWNVSGLKSEADTWSYLNHIETVWPDVHLVVLTESHLTSENVNDELSSNEKWEAHHLPQRASSHTNWGGIVLLAKKGMFTSITRQQDFQDHHLDAAIWEVRHASWPHPLHLTGFYRNQPAGKSRGGAEAYERRGVMESTQMAAFDLIGKAMRSAPGPAIAVGDLNIALGKLQERWTHKAKPKCKERLSDHNPHIGSSSLASQMMSIINQKELMVINGRFGNASAATTYEKATSTSLGVQPTHTTIDYAFCRQDMQTQILDMSVERNDIGKDHSPIMVSLQCALLPSRERGEPATQWLNPVDRGLLDMSPIATPDWEDEGLKSKYQSQLQHHLREVNSELEALRAKQKKSLQQPAGKRATGSIHAQQQQWTKQISEIYSKLTAGVLAAATECLPRKKTPSLRGGMRTRPRTQWHPDATWHRLKQRAQESWQKHKDMPQDHADALLSKRTYREACRDLRIHTSQSRTRWLSQRLHNTSLHAPSHTVKFTWEKLKRSLGSESISGLPAQVRGGDGRVLHGQEAAAEWHRKRAEIGKYDSTAPFNAKAQAMMKLQMHSILQKEATDSANAAPPRKDQGVMNAGITKEEISACLQRASTNTAPGTDEIYNELLKQGGDFLSDLLHTFFNAVWEAEAGPDEWSLALVRPLYKSKSKDPLAIENYRAITLINTICKLYEDILCDRVVTHLETSKGISTSQGGSRRSLGCQEMVYTLVSAARLRKEALQAGTYCCFLDLKLAYPSTDHDVIFSKLHSKGIHGRLFRNIKALYENMRSRVIHPDIAADDYFNIEVGAREGSVLSPILFLVAIDDMQEYLAARPFQQDASTAGQSAKRQRTKGKAPGVRISKIYLPLLQYVDDAVLLARSPEELQHMINVIAEYCSENRLVLNPNEGKTEVVEFMCEASDFAYTVASPKHAGDMSRARIHVKQGYQYLGWWLDKELTLQEHTDRIGRLLVGAAARVVRMGGRPGALPVRTTFLLWSSLALSHVHGSAALLSRQQVDRLQQKMRAAVRQMSGNRSEPTAVLADLGIPDATTIARMRSANLFVRLRTLPGDLAPASLHRFIMSLPTHSRRTSFENGMLQTLQDLQLTDIEPQSAVPPESLLVSADDPEKGIGGVRRRWGREIKKQAWAQHCNAMIAGQPPFDSAKMKRYVKLAGRDITRKDPSKCAAYLKLELSSKQESALLQLRTGGSLLATDAEEYDSPMGPDHRCVACLESQKAEDTTLEDHYHALFDCCKPPLAKRGRREQWWEEMQKVLDRWKVVGTSHNGGAVKLRWLELDMGRCVEIALGVVVPEEWRSGETPRFAHTLRTKERESLHAELVSTSAPFLVDMCKGLRDYQLAILQGLEDGDPDFEAVFLLLDAAAPMSEHSSESEADSDE